MNTASHVCCYINCSNTQKNNKDLSFFKFPIKDAHQTEGWKKRCGNIKIVMMDNEHLKNKVICEKHFLPSVIIINSKKKILRRGALPIMWSGTYLFINRIPKEACRNKCPELLEKPCYRDSSSEKSPEK